MHIYVYNAKKKCHIQKKRNRSEDTWQRRIFKFTKNTFVFWIFFTINMYYFGNFI